VSAENAEALLAKADVICEAFDNAEAKAMLVNTALEKMPEKFLVAASGMAGYDSGNTITTRKVTKRFYVCGDGKSDVNDGIGLIAPRVMLCAAHQALTAVRLIIDLA
jgi:sulfur carrier protein ThiS adenylyltransferase